MFTSYYGSGFGRIDLNQQSYSTPSPVSTWMGDHLWVGKPSQYVTAIEVDLAFYSSWYGKMSYQLSG